MSDVLDYESMQAEIERLRALVNGQRADYADIQAALIAAKARESSGSMKHFLRDCKFGEGHAGPCEALGRREGQRGEAMSDSAHDSVEGFFYWKQRAEAAEAKLARVVEALELIRDKAHGFAYGIANEALAAAKASE